MDSAQEERRSPERPVKYKLADAFLLFMGKPVNTLIRCTAWVFVAYFFAPYLPDLSNALTAFAGKETKADIRVEGEFNNGGATETKDDSTTEILLLLVALGSVGYGRRQRKLKGDVTERLTKRITELEMMIDNNRSSSGLTSRGDNQPEDDL